MPRRGRARVGRLACRVLDARPQHDLGDCLALRRHGSALELRGCACGWERTRTADRDRNRATPTPTMYLAALDVLGVAASEAVVFEDSPNGVKAARAAGIFVVAIPNNVTRDFGLGEADLVVESLADLPPDELLARFS